MMTTRPGIAAVNYDGRVVSCRAAGPTDHACGPDTFPFLDRPTGEVGARRARHPIKRGGRRGGGVGGVRASAALFPTFTSFVKVGSTGRGGRPREPGLGQRASGGASSFSRERCPMLGARHTKTAAKGGTRQSCPPLHLFQILEGGIREAERGARAGPVRSVGGRGVRGGGATLASLCARLERVQGLRNGSSAKASVAALGAAHGAERPPPRGRARGRAARSWPRRRWLNIRGEVGTSRSSPPTSDHAARDPADGVAAPSSAQTLPTASRCPPGSRNEPGSRPELQPLTGKGEESAGRRSAQAAPRRSRAPVQREGSGRRLIAPAPYPTHCLAVPAFQPQRTRFAAGTATFNRERSKNQPGGGRYKLLLAARARPRSGEAAVDVAARSSALAYPLPSRAQPGSRNEARFAAGTATINRERWKSIREEVGTSRSSPLARARRRGKGGGRRRNALSSASPHFPPTHRPPLRRNRKTLQHARRRGLWGRRVVLKSVGRAVSGVHPVRLLGCRCPSGGRLFLLF